MIFHQPHNSLSNYNYNTNFYTDTAWENHFHKNLEFIYVIDGILDCTVNNVNYQLSKGNCGLCLPYDVHSLHPQKNTLYWVLVFSEDFIHYFSKQIENKDSKNFIFNLEKSTENYILNKLIYAENPSVLTFKSCLYAICDEYHNSTELTNKKNKINEITSFIIDFIKDNYSKKITLYDISKQLGYDYNYTSRFFSKTFNMTFTNFVNIYRLEKAIELLEHTDKSVLSIANESGFQSLRNFNRFFKEKLNVTPSEYKKTFRKLIKPSLTINPKTVDNIDKNMV